MDNATEISGTLTDLSNENPSLRSLITHYTSVSEGAKSAFTIHLLEDGRALIFDCEALGYPVLATTQKLAVAVPYVVMNALAIYLGTESELPSRDLATTWENPTAVYSQHLDPTERGPLVQTVGMRLDGFEIETRHLLPDVFERAQKPIRSRSAGRRRRR